MKNRIIHHLKRLHTGLPPKSQSPEEPIHFSERKDNPFVNFFLFVATFVTTTIAGAHTGSTIAESFMSGLPYSCTIMTILLSHEMGHYIAAKRFGVVTTLPYFIPVYFPSTVSFGTMGAIIRTKTPIRDRRGLLYIGSMGPLLGFAISLCAVIIGIYLSEIKQIPVPKGDDAIPIFGESILFKFIVTLIHGTIPTGHRIVFSPYAFAGWIGFFITSLNLMPLGQLDGSHILYALVGKKQVVFGWIVFVALMFLSFIWPGWIVWVILTLVFLMVAHPPVPEGIPLSFPEKLMGWSCMIILMVTFIPMPLTLIMPKS